MQKKLISFHSPLNTAGRIDEQNAVINGVSVITCGIEAEGHNLWIDGKTIDQLMASANEAGRERTQAQWLRPMAVRRQ